MVSRIVRAAPLSGLKIVATRARAQSSGFARLLRFFGARVLVCPTIRIVAPASLKPLDRAVRSLETYDWLIFTSVNGVEKFGERFRKLLRGKKFPSRLKTCAIGPATARELRSLKIPVSKISRDYVAESILEILPRVKGLKILIPRASVARDVLPVTLRKRGARVDVVEAYRTVPDSSRVASLERWMKRGGIDCVTFTSSSTVHNFFGLLNGKQKRDILKNRGIKAASIGPVTTATLKEHGWAPEITAGKPTTRHLAGAIVNFYRKKNSKGGPKRA